MYVMCTLPDLKKNDNFLKLFLSLLLKTIIVDKNRKYIKHFFTYDFFFQDLNV